MRNTFPAPRSILVTGASSGLGAALARAYAGEGVSLALSGRNRERLDQVAEDCRALGASVTSACLEVTERQAMADWVREQAAERPLDLVVANAGVSAGTGGGGESDLQAREIFATNVDGVMNTVLPALAPMRARGRGQIAIVSSMAGFRGFPGAPAYCASKAAVRVWGESLRGHLRADGVGVSVICPGFVRSRMTEANDFPMPLLMDAEKAAQVVRKGLARNKARIVFPRRLWAAVWLLAALPPGLTDRLLARMPEKSS